MKARPATTKAGRCPECGAPRTKKDTGPCLRCATLAKLKDPLVDPNGVHKCEVDGCERTISNRYPNLTNCVEHALTSARAERARLSVEGAITHLKRVKTGRKLARENRRRRREEERAMARQRKAEDTPEAETSPTDTEVAPTEAPLPEGDAMKSNTVKKTATRKGNTTTKRTASKSGATAKRAAKKEGAGRSTDEELIPAIKAVLKSEPEAKLRTILVTLRKGGLSCSRKRLRPLLKKLSK